MQKQPKYKNWSFISLIVTIFNIGRSPFAPGTLGSLVAAIEFTIYISLLTRGFIVYYEYLAFVMFLAFVTVHLYVEGNNKKDPQEVIIDEYVGQYIAQLFSVHFLILVWPELTTTFFYFVIAVSFILFRVFDIAKPSLVGYCDKNIKGAIGVMLDDIVAGFFSAILTIITFVIYVSIIS